MQAMPRPKPQVNTALRTGCVASERNAIRNIILILTPTPRPGRLA